MIPPDLPASAYFMVTGLLAGGWLLARLPTPRLPTPCRLRACRQTAPSGPTGPVPPVSIVIPARNEAMNLAVSLASLALLDPAPHEVILVDDESTDSTAEVASSFGVEVLGSPPRPPGWMGKPWACQVGADTASGSMLLFLDADTSLAPDALARLCHEHDLMGGGLLSVQPYHQVHSPVEELSAIPNLVTMMGTGAFAAWPRIVPDAAFGPCLMTSASEYGSIGGHASVQGQLVEDVHLARRYRDRGLPVLCLSGGQTVRFRMYPEGLGQLIEGWTKNLAGGAAIANRMAVLGAVCWVMSLAAIATRGITLFVSTAAGSTTADPLVDLTLWVIAATLIRSRLRRIGSFRAWTAILFPIPLAAFVLIFLRSLVLTRVRKQVTWRGRHIDLPSAKPL